MNKQFDNLKRPLNPMPEYVKKALENRGLMPEYTDRPAYQQNDYLWWINDAKTQKTKEKRLIQMLKELEMGGVYMNMGHPPSEKK
jgi:uncharacterized protein YdeI (YjbR/CyaY-like superfamily)